MSLDITHPEFNSLIADWEELRDCYKGESVVKAKGVKYLKPTKSMILDGMAPGQIGNEVYQAYKDRASFGDYFSDGVAKHSGRMWAKNSVVNLPKELEYLHDNATVDGEGILMLLRRINEEQLITGRCGILLDMKKDSNDGRFYIAMYDAENIRNWGDDFVVLDESGYQQENFEWATVKRRRVLKLIDGKYHQGEFVDTDEYSESQMFTPMWRGKAFDEIPFSFCNVKDITRTPDKSPMFPLSKLTLALYRLDADHQQQLYYQGQDTLVIIGATQCGFGEAENEPIRTGTGAVISVDIGGDAKYIGVSPNGLAERREIMQSLSMKAEKMAGDLIASGARESGEALRIRVASQSTTLESIVTTGAACLERLLRMAARWIGADEDQVNVVPNTDFVKSIMSGEEVKGYAEAKNMGAPISNETIHAMMVRGGITALSYEDEIDRIEEERNGFNFDEEQKAFTEI